MEHVAERLVLVAPVHSDRDDVSADGGLCEADLEDVLQAVPEGGLLVEHAVDRDAAPVLCLSVLERGVVEARGHGEVLRRLHKVNRRVLDGAHLDPCAAVVPLTRAEGGDLIVVRTGEDVRRLHAAEHCRHALVHLLLADDPGKVLPASLIVRLRVLGALQADFDLVLSLRHIVLVGEAFLVRRLA